MFEDKIRLEKKSKIIKIFLLYVETYSIFEHKLETHSLEHARNTLHSRE